MYGKNLFSSVNFASNNTPKFCFKNILIAVEINRYFWVFTPRRPEFFSESLGKGCCKNTEFYLLLIVVSEG